MTLEKYQQIVGELYLALMEERETSANLRKIIEAKKEEGANETEQAKSANDPA